MKSLYQKFPFGTYYAFAVGLPTLLFSYMIVMEIFFPNANGEGISLATGYFAQRDRLIADYPVLFHHRDSVWLYVTGYALMPLAAPFFFFPFAPTLSALLATGIGHGKAALKALLRLYRPIQGNLTAAECARIYALLLGFIIVIISGVFIVEMVAGDPAKAGTYARSLGLVDLKTLAVTFVMALFFNQGALLEELGWRGYGLPLLIRKLQSPLLATLILGTAWTFWHFPREIPALLSGQQDLAQLAVGQVYFWVWCVSASVVMTYFVNITGGSILPAIMLHGTFNHVGGMFSAAQMGARNMFSFQSPLLWFCCAVVILLFAGKDLGWRRRLEINGGDGHLDPSLAWSGKKDSMNDQA